MEVVMTLTELPRGSRITIFEPPPDFDPLAADDRDLQRFGFPPRPVDPRYRARYEHILRRLGSRLHYVTPTFRLNKEVFHGPARRVTTEATETSSNWSGGVVSAPPQQPFSWVQADWTIPNFVAPDMFQLYKASIWVGIDGEQGSTDVCQAGITGWAIDILGATFGGVYAWWEWYPEAEVAFTNFPVSVGDMITVVVCAGSTSAYVYLADQTNGAVTSVNFSAPEGTTLTGNCAEWIVEAPQVNGQQVSLANYNEVLFTSCDAVAFTSSDAIDIVGGGTGNNIDMFDSNNNEISEGILVSPTVVECQYL
jgi:hypothetical protein